MGTAGSPGRVPLEALILAFTHSRARNLVGTDALRSVLSGRYREIHRDGVFDLEPVWELCAEQPGFEPDQVRSVLCRFKTWEAPLRVAVKLPAAMGRLTDAQIAELAAPVQVPMRERARVFEGSLVAPGDPEAAAADPVEPRPATGRAPLATAIPPTMKTPRLRRISRGRRRAIELAALLLAVVGFGAAGLQVQRSCRTEAWEAMPLGFAGDIPIGVAERQGPEVGGELRDARWLALPASVRTAQMKAALEALPQDVQVFFVRDADRQVRAVARWFGEPRQISVTLQ